jgi:hypothetical protein
MNDLKFAVSPFPADGFAGCYVTLVGTRGEITGHILVSKSYKSLVEMGAEIGRLKNHDQREPDPEQPMDSNCSPYRLVLDSLAWARHT